MAAAQPSGEPASSQPPLSFSACTHPRRWSRRSRAAAPRARPARASRRGCRRGDQTPSAPRRPTACHSAAASSRPGPPQTAHVGDAERGRGDESVVAASRASPATGSRNSEQQGAGRQAGRRGRGPRQTHLGQLDDAVVVDVHPVHQVLHLCGGGCEERRGEQKGGVRGGGEAAGEAGEDRSRQQLPPLHPPCSQTHPPRGCRSPGGRAQSPARPSTRCRWR